MIKLKIILLIGLITICVPSIYGGDAGSILNKRSESIGHYRKDGDRIIIYDRQWNRKGHIENSGKGWKRGSILDNNNRKLGYIEKKGNQISIFDKQWNRKGYAIVDDREQRYFNQEPERVDPDELLRELKK